MSRWTPTPRRSSWPRVPRDMWQPGLPAHVRVEPRSLDVLPPNRICRGRPSRVYRDDPQEGFRESHRQPAGRPTDGRRGHLFRCRGRLQRNEIDKALTELPCCASKKDLKALETELRGCTRELAGKGSPSERLRPVFALVKKARAIRQGREMLRYRRGDRHPAWWLGRGTQAQCRDQVRLLGSGQGHRPAGRCRVNGRRGQTASNLSHEGR
jgi:hypothetical protein